MLTLEQYLNVAYLWHAEQHQGYNPFDRPENIEELQSMINQDEYATMPADGWIDVANDGVSTIEDDIERHAEKFTRDT